LAQPRARAKPARHIKPRLAPTENPRDRPQIREARLPRPARWARADAAVLQRINRRRLPVKREEALRLNQPPVAALARRREPLQQRRERVQPRRALLVADGGGG